ncbi:MAG: Adaptive-response sensory-kinase SasA [Syntrophus sp. SKADARSKE-3]|nr:Adaptive-response sensory-kinase SasA [Syntrophus sp. SKADARSKE-3]
MRSAKTTKKISNITLYLGLIPVLLLIATISLLHLVFHNYPIARIVFDPPLLVLILNTIFLCIALYVVSYRAMKSYLLNGSPTILFLGCGTLSLGTGSLLAGWLVGPSGTNVLVTVHNTTALIAAMFSMAGTVANVLEWPPEDDPKQRRRLLLIYYISIVIFSAATALAAVLNITPPFFEQGVGPTHLRQAVLISALWLFVISSAAMMIRFAEKGMQFLYWYSLALMLLALGMGGIFLQPAVGSPIGWAARIAQYLAGIYFLAAIIAALRDAKTQGVTFNDVIADVFHQSERKIAAILNSMTDCHYELDKEWRFTRINDRALAYFGKNREDFIGRNYWDALSAPRNNTFEEHFAKALSEGVSVHFDLPSAAVPGKWAEMHAYPTDEGLSVYFRDITERKQTEKDLRESEDRLRFALETSHTGAWDLDLVGHSAYRSLEHDKIFGYSELLPQWTYEMFIDHVLPEDRAYVDAKFHHATDTLGDWSFECRIRRADGKIRWIWAAGRHRTDGDGGLHRMAGIVQDITERKRAEDDLRRSENRLNILIKNIKSGVSLIDDTGKFSIVNPTFLQMFGLKDGETIKSVNDQNWGDWQVFESDGTLLHVDEHPVRKVVLTGKSVVNKFVGVRLPSGGDLIWMLVSADPILRPDGSIESIICTYHDVTERKYVEDVLKEQTRQLEEVNKEMESFSYSVSHDLRAPLRAIEGFSRIILRRQEHRLDEDGKRQLQVIIDNVKKMGELIDDLLTFSRLGRQEVTKLNLNVDELIHEIWGELVTIDSGRAMTLKMEPMPVLLGDRALIRQVYVNLLGNAAKFARGRNPTVIEVGSCIKNGEPVYYVRDNGIGFNMKYYDKLFGVFQRLHSDAEYEGTGIGLALVQRIIHRHGGRVWAEGEVNKGATFYFALPQKEID